MVQYSLEVAICWSVLYLIYICILKRETFFSINRGYLLSSLCIGLIIPFVRMIEWRTQWQQDIILSEPLQYIAIGPSYIAASVSETTTTEGFSISPMQILIPVYCLGVLFMSLRFINGLRKLYGMYRNGVKTKKESFMLVETNSYL